MSPNPAARITRACKLRQQPAEPRQRELLGASFYGGQETNGYLSEALVSGHSGPSDGMCNSPGTGRFKEISQGRAYNARIAAQSVVNFVVAASIAIAEPINSKFRRLPEGQVPQRADHYRTLWRCFHAVRNLAALAALAFLAAAAVVQN
jgi:hypothetical protein